jgi:ElaB/YqjD/DUF883 family membrane-anchored ribosome-binding protein
MITRDRVGTEIGLMSGRIKQTFLNSRDSLASARTAVSEKTRRAARKTDYYVHDNAWKMMGFAAGLAFVTGFVLSRISEDRLESVLAADVNGNAHPIPEPKRKSFGTWELVHSAIPLALFLWKATQSSRCAKRELVLEKS